MPEMMSFMVAIVSVDDYSSDRFPIVSINTVLYQVGSDSRVVSRLPCNQHVLMLPVNNQATAMGQSRRNNNIVAVAYCRFRHAGVGDRAAAYDDRESDHELR